MLTSSLADNFAAIQNVSCDLQFLKRKTLHCNFYLERYFQEKRSIIKTVTLPDTSLHKRRWLKTTDYREVKRATERTRDVGLDLLYMNKNVR